jgi:hypothetical protein
LANQAALHAHQNLSRFCSVLCPSQSNINDAPIKIFLVARLPKFVLASYTTCVQASDTMSLYNKIYVKISSRSLPESNINDAQLNMRGRLVFRNLFWPATRICTDLPIQVVDVVASTPCMQRTPKPHASIHKQRARLLLNLY